MTQISWLLSFYQCTPFHQFYLLKYPKYYFTCCPCTLKCFSFWFLSSTTLEGNTCVTVGKLDHLDLRFPKNNLRFECNNNTRSPRLNSPFSILNHDTSSFFLYRVLPLSYTHSGNSFVTLIFSSLKFMASLQLRLIFFCIHKDLCSCSNNKWHALPKNSW